VKTGSDQDRAGSKQKEIIRIFEMKKRVITVVPCRLKSSRLPEKALQPIFGISSIQRCLLNTFEISSSKISVLATTTNPEDRALRHHTVNGKADFICGSEEDVLDRFLKAIERHSADIVIRVTGDCPVVSYEIADLLVEAHLNSDADVTYAEPGFAVGTNSEVYTAKALYRLRERMPQTLHSEYLIYYFLNNPDIFRLNSIALPSYYHRGWRLTLDERTDLDLFEHIFSNLKIDWRAISFSEIVNFLVAHPDVASINSSSKLRYVHDQNFAVYLNKVTKISNP